MRLLGVFIGALVTDLTTGLGALPLLFKPKHGKEWLGISTSIAAGAMVAASVGLMLEGFHESLAKTFGGAALGIVIMTVLRKLLEGHEPQYGQISARDAKRMFIVVAVMTLHSFTEGIGIGVSFGGGQPLGVFVTTAMAIHNIPEGLAIALAMVPHGVSVSKAALWGIFSSLPQPVMAVPAYLLVDHFKPVLPWGLGFAAGAMVWTVLAELAPESLRHTTRTKAAAGFLISAAAMMALQIWLDVAH